MPMLLHFVECWVFARSAVPLMQLLVQVLVHVSQSVEPFRLLVEVVLKVLVMLLQCFMLLLQFVHARDQLLVLLLEATQSFLGINRVALVGLLELLHELACLLLCIFLALPEQFYLPLVLNVLAQALLQLVLVVF